MSARRVALLLRSSSSARSAQVHVFRKESVQNLFLLCRKNQTTCRGFSFFMFLRLGKISTVKVSQWMKAPSVGFHRLWPSAAASVSRQVQLLLHPKGLSVARWVIKVLENVYIFRSFLLTFYELIFVATVFIFTVLPWRLLQHPLESWRGSCGSKKTSCRPRRFSDADQTSVLKAVSFNSWLFGHFTTSSLFKDKPHQVQIISCSKSSLDSLLNYICWGKFVMGKHQNSAS